MSARPTYKGFNREVDLPLLGVDLNAASDWEPVDNGVRPDNRDPMEFVDEDHACQPAIVGLRPDIGRGDHEGPFYSDGDGRALMEYHRELAQSYEDSRVPADVALNEVVR